MAGEGKEAAAVVVGPCSVAVVVAGKLTQPLSLSLFGAAPPRRHTYSNRKELLCSAAAPALSCFSFLVLVKQHQGVG